MPRDERLALLSQATPRELADLESLVQAEVKADYQRMGLWYCNRADCDGEPHIGWPVKHARANQRPDLSADYDLFLLFGGRGGGKTRGGAEWLGDQVRQDFHRDPTGEGGAVGEEVGGEWAAIGPTFAHARDVMIEGESGLLRALGWKGESNPGPFVKTWNRSQGQVRLNNGDVVYADGASDGAPRVQGKNLRGAWCDELRLWGARAWYAWHESLTPALRKGRALVCATTTPSPTKLLKGLLADPSTHVKRVRMVDNISNLSAKRVERLVAKYKGTKVGLSELDGVMVEGVDGALWTYDMFQRRGDQPARAFFQRVVVAVDPSDGTEDGDEMGIAVVGLGLDWNYYVLHSEGLRVGTIQMLKRAAYLRRKFGADALVVERNHGGQALVELAHETLRNVPTQFTYASEGKRTRAEPISWQYQQGRVIHVGVFEELEEQMTNFTGRPNGKGADKHKSPDRLDALVWGISNLLEWVTPEEQRDESPTDPKFGAASPVVPRRKDETDHDNPWGEGAGLRPDTDGMLALDLLTAGL